MRKEFSKATKAAAMLRCGGRCEECGDKLLQPEYDHIVAAALGGTADLDNCMVLCVDCHAKKTHSKGGDRWRVRKADRLKDKHSGNRKSKAVMAGSRNSKWKKPMRGPAVRRNERNDDD